MTTRRLRAPVLALMGLMALTGAALAQDATPDPADPAAPATADTKPPPAPAPAPPEDDLGGPPPLPPPPATPPPLPPQPVYWIDEGGTQGGPYAIAELEARVTSGTLKPGTLAWTEGMADWSPASVVEGLAPLFAAQPDPATAPVPDPAPAFDAATFVVGSWRQQGPMRLDGGGTGTADLIAEFRADSGFAIRGTIDTTMTGQLQRIEVSAEGTYAVRPGQGQQFMMTYNGMMQVDMGFGPQATPLTDSTVYERVDDDTIRDPGTGETLTRLR